MNQTSATSAGGALNNGFAPTTTLGCGSWGGNSISENLDYKHLMNVSRIGKVIVVAEVPPEDDAQGAVGMRVVDRESTDGLFETIVGGVTGYFFGG